MQLIIETRNEGVHKLRKENNTNEIFYFPNEKNSIKFNEKKKLNCS